LKRYLFFVALLVICFRQNLHAQLQGQPYIDSLLKELPKATEDTNKVNLLNAIAYNYYSINSDDGIKYGQQSLALAEELNWKKGIAIANHILGVNYFSKSDYPKSLEYHLKALRINEELKEKKGIAKDQLGIGLVYDYQGEYAKALEYDLKALKIEEELDDKYNIEINLGNIGEVYQNQNDYPKAQEYYGKALQMSEKLGDKMGIAINTGNIGEVYAYQKEYVKALEYFLKVLKIFEDLGNKNAIATSMGNIGEVYFKMAKNAKNAKPGDNVIILSQHDLSNKALSYTDSAIALCKEIGYLGPLIEFSKNLSSLDSFMGDNVGALQAYKQYTFYHDSVYSNQNKQKIYDLETKRALELKDKQIEIDRLAIAKKRNERLFFGIGIVGLLLVIVFIARERKRSDILLLNILPAKIAARLKQKEHPIADHFKEASILFIDMAGFTKFTEGRDPKETVSELNLVFTKFDAIAEKHGLEKIKTIGDCYMAVAGLPEPRTDHASVAASMALDVKEALKGYTAKDGTPMLFRMGLDCGPVVAGVIGKNKFIYDLWGNAVNIASRMENTGIVGEVHCTDNFKNALHNSSSPLEKSGEVSFISRGIVDIKGKGQMETWLMS